MRAHLGAVTELLLLFLACCFTIFMSRVAVAAMSTTATTSSCAGSTRLLGKRVLVTGSGRGIGRAIARICASEGAAVAVMARTRSELDETLSEMKNLHNNDVLPHISIEADVTDDKQVNDLVDTIMQEWGGLDVLINNAGVSQSSKGKCEDLPIEDLNRILHMNVVAVQRVTAAVLKKGLMIKDGHIVNISSRAGKIGIPNTSFYVASKFGVEGLTASWALELKDRNIHVNSLSPGMVNTRSFPKEPDRKGVRTAESVYDGLLAILESDKSGHYLHVDELDLARERGLDDSVALKPINEPKFDP